MNRLLAALLLAAAACARIAPPPGGPPDRRPPVLVSTTPDSLRILPGFDDDVEFQFDEVVSEGGSPNFGLGTGGLEKLVALSPSTEVPVVKWKRSRITVRPREGWQPDRVYRVELLAGVQDLRNNQSKASVVVTFTTGAPLPVDTLVGRVVDWTTQRPVPLAMVEALLLPDSLSYRTAADSTGRFRFGPLPPGEYLVAGIIDQNRNGRREPRELYDSIRVVAGRDSVGEIWAFRHDTLPPRIQSATRTDTLSASVTFNMHLDPYQEVSADSVQLLALPDSTPVAVEALLPQPLFDSLYRAKRDTTPADSVQADSARADSVRRAREDSLTRARAAQRDTVPARIPGVPRTVAGARVPPPRRDTLDTGPLKTKPMLFDKLFLRAGERLADSGRYVVRVRGIRSVSGVTGVAQGVLSIEPPKQPVRPDSAAARRDSTRARPDSVTPPADTARARPDTAGVPPRR